ncbi:MAG: tRNA pseudouridine(55) synthase TruB [Chlamydiota bacterium]|jgi:tRNA pseudouridine55 synthase
MANPPTEGLLLVNKSVGSTSFSVIRKLRKLLNVKKIGHAGTLDPFATGVMIYLIGKNFTKKSAEFMHLDKEYLATIFLGKTTDTYDVDGKVLSESDYVPTLDEVKTVIEKFQGEIEQVPPMFSAKKINGKKLYELARKNIEVERKTEKIHVTTTLVSYNYPNLCINVACSKGTYIRSIAYDMGNLLTCGAYLSALTRTRVGSYLLENCFDEKDILESPQTVSSKIKRSI